MSFVLRRFLEKNCFLFACGVGLPCVAFVWVVLNSLCDVWLCFFCMFQVCLLCCVVICFVVLWLFVLCFVVLCELHCCVCLQCCVLLKKGCIGFCV